ncbi:His Kinase A (phospho-acceptor) domain-containing protein [Clostridium collagenovorans DSM 3089]|uniref:histidine kinase n=1 Tax=Clostridium collagenovorans DSM 3089 TaxID=1121306 RepID=A0A1M5SCW5_9CLOT|nr:ATP-binding protein [Clostridium collagenovorans]SHH35743.1 His Kinase A (phospho-acceptor) domain-containing protein [Clostridium collagenovorans DSM 3089]
MFRKLKRNLIIINMCLLTTVFIAILSLIYFNTAANMNNKIKMDLNSIIMDSKPNTGKSMPKDTLSVIVDSNNKIINSNSHMFINASDIPNLVDMALSTNGNSNKIQFLDNTYMFLKKSMPIGTKIAFFDISKEKEVLINILKEFLLMGSFVLIILFGVSIFLTSKTIKPIKESFEKQKQFIADASHELKTPLAIIKTNSSVLLENSDDTIRNQIKWLNYIDSQTNRMSLLINEMLSLTKLDTEEQGANFSQIDLSKLIENTLLSFEAVLFENDIKLESTIIKNIIISAELEDIKKLFNILLDNAIKYTTKNGKININLYEENNKVKLSIRNTGQGIEKKNLEKIFERFYRVDISRARYTGGYGLGLSIAKSIVQKHHGKIYAESIVNESATFMVELPLK